MPSNGPQPCWQVFVCRQLPLLAQTQTLDYAVLLEEDRCSVNLLSAVQYCNVTCAQPTPCPGASSTTRWSQAAVRCRQTVCCVPLPLSGRTLLFCQETPSGPWNRPRRDSEADCGKRLQKRRPIRGCIQPRECAPLSLSIKSL